MKSFAFAAVCIFFVSLYSCKKDTTGSSNPTTTTSTKVKTYIEELQSSDRSISIDTFNIIYNSADKIISMTSSSGGNFNYEYNTNDFFMYIGYYSHRIITVHFFLNSNHLVDSSLQYNDTNDSSTERYIYNSKQQLVQYRHYYYRAWTGGAALESVTNYGYDSDGNLITQTEAGPDGNTTKTRRFTYNNVKNKVNISTPFYPVLHINLPVTETILDGSGAVTATVNYEYTYDSLNRVKVEKKSDSYKNVVIKKYFYL